MRKKVPVRRSAVASALQCKLFGHKVVPNKKKQNKRKKIRPHQAIDRGLFLRENKIIAILKQFYYAQMRLK